MTNFIPNVLYINVFQIIHIKLCLNKSIFLGLIVFNTKREVDNGTLRTLSFC